MRKLLFSNFFCLSKSKLFRGEIIFMIFSGIIAALGMFAQYKIHLVYGQIITLDQVFYGYSLLIGILTAILSSFFFWARSIVMAQCVTKLFVDIGKSKFIFQI